MTTSLEIRTQIVDLLRRDLVGPHPEKDPDLARERLDTSPSRWYLTGYLTPAEDGRALNGKDAGDDPSAQEETETEVEVSDEAGAGGAAGDDEAPEAPSTKRRFYPSSIGLTVFLDPSIKEIEAHISWGDYRTEPPLPEELFEPEAPREKSEVGKDKRTERPKVDWVRVPKSQTVPVRIQSGRGKQITVPESAAEQRRGGGLVLETDSRIFSYQTPEGASRDVRALTVFLVNRRSPVHRAYSDVGFIFQARLELVCESGFAPRQDVSGYFSTDWDRRIADLHYRDVCEYASGRNTAAGWDAAEEAAHKVTRVWTDPLPLAEVERIAPDEDEPLRAQVTFGMERLAELAGQGSDALQSALAQLPELYGVWMEVERNKVASLSQRRRETAEKLIAEMEIARKRIARGIDILARDEKSRTAFRIMNVAVGMAAKRRGNSSPEWRPFQLAFILLNLAGLSDRTDAERETADLLFFPTGGGKTEAYLGLAAFVIAHRRLSAHGVLGAGVAVIMRYTLRLLTLDQLARAAGVVCALELMRTDPQYTDEGGRKLLGDSPIEIGLWVGSDASPNRLGRAGDADQDTAIGRVRRYRDGKDKRAPAPLKACPWCGTPFTKDSFRIVPNNTAPENIEIACANLQCDFVRNRPLPILTVDEPIYLRLPAFLIATVDKFASLPWEGQTGAFFGYVDRYATRNNGVEFYGPMQPAVGQPLPNGWKLDPPDLIIQDELHLISGPLGTVAGLYETAIDRLAMREVNGKRVRPKIVASTATVRRAEDQIRALFDRQTTAIFPPPGIDRTDSFFARTIPATREPGRLYLGIAAQGRGPKLVFLRCLTSMLAAAHAAYDSNQTSEAVNAADPYMTAVCYFNALRELGGARRIVEDEVRERVARYGRERRRLDPQDQPFGDRKIREPMELTSRESTDKVALAKRKLETEFGTNAETIDVALATNMISVGLDITRLGLMLVQGQPKTAAEYIQATSRVGRDFRRPGLVLAILNLHKPRDRTHFEQFGNFHRTFYRSVEATSVTPWASRALDRALAAVIVSTARHLDPALTPERAVIELKNRPDIRAAMRELLVTRAPEAAIAGGRAALEKLTDRILDAWATTADEQSAGGNEFAYARKQSPQRLLHMPLDAGLPNLSENHRLFIAGRSMRDVESSVALKVTDPYGGNIANADDLA